MKKAISLFLVFSILLLSGNVFAKEKKGADLIILKTDGTKVRGELIAVKANSLILIERRSGADVPIKISEIKTARIHKNSLLPTTIGLSAGLATGFGVIAATAPKEQSFAEPWDLGPAMAGLVIAALGLTIGIVAGTDKTFLIEGKSDSETQEILKELSKKARVKNAM